jgi:hypothetical protein
LDAGAVKAIVACPFPAVAEREVGAPGATIGSVVIDPLAEDAEEVPALFVAVTVNVYAVPAVNPVTVIGDVVPVAVMEPGEDVTV